MTSDLNQLRVLTELRYARARQGLESLIAEENRLRGEVAKLDRHLTDARRQSPQQAPMRAIGADVIWNQWADRAKMRINLELAQVLAQKEARLAHVRKAHGRLLVSDQLAQQQSDRLRTDGEKRTLGQALEMSVLGILKA